MYTIAICAVLGFVLGLALIGSSKYANIFPEILLFPLIGGMVGFIIFIMSGFFLTGPEDFRKIKTEKELVSLSSNISSEASFFLGIGSFSGTKKYYYFVNTDRGAINKSVYANETYIEEFENGTTRILKVRYESIFNHWHAVMHAVMDHDEYNRIWIPEGSIKHQYKPN